MRLHSVMLCGRFYMPAPWDNLSQSSQPPAADPRRSSILFTHPHMNRMEEIQMTTINLKDFYAWYTHDEYIEVSDEVAAELKADKLYEAAHQRRTTRNKAQYSLDCDDGIEYSACLHEPTPQELLDRMELFVHLWNALNSLPEVQGVRVEAHLILGKSYRQIAREQGVDKSAVRHSVKSGKAAMRKYLKKFL